MMLYTVYDLNVNICLPVSDYRFENETKCDTKRYSVPASIPGMYERQFSFVDKCVQKLHVVCHVLTEDAKLYLN